MQLNHINLPVPDVLATAGYLKEFFGLKDLGPKPSRTMALLRDDHGMVLNVSNFSHTDRVEYPGTFHIGFTRESKEEVDAIYRRLAGAGLAKSPPRHFHGSWTFYVTAPGGFTVEVQHFESAAFRPKTPVA
jgi:lactoylglutathione lyase